MLAGAMTLQLLAYFKQVPTSPPPHFSKSIPRHLQGWTNEDLPLAETEELKNGVIETLQFDEYVSQSYRRGPVTLTLYAAYWRHGKVPPRAVGVHTPDTCWVQNGWTRTSRTSGVSVMFCEPAEFGVYVLRGNTQYVYFWHLVGGRPYSYDQEGLHSLTAPLQDLKNFGLNQRRDQLFVRLAANVPFEQLQNDAGYLALLYALSDLGLKMDSVQQTRR